MEFAKKAGVTRQAVNKMIKQKRIQAMLFGKTYLIDRQELSKYLATRKK
jgi:excisionase family DNA binding protein